MTEMATRRENKVPDLRVAGKVSTEVMDYLKSKPDRRPDHKTIKGVSGQLKALVDDVRRN